VVAIGSNDGDNLIVKTTIQREPSGYPPLVALSRRRTAVARILERFWFEVFCVREMQFLAKESLKKRHSVVSDR